MKKEFSNAGAKQNVWGAVVSTPASLARILFLALILGITGCVGYVDGGVGYAGPVVEGPDVVVFTGHPHGHYDRDYGRRGAWSRGHGHWHR